MIMTWWFTCVFFSLFLDFFQKIPFGFSPFSPCAVPTPLGMISISSPSAVAVAGCEAPAGQPCNMALRRRREEAMSSWCFFWLHKTDLFFGVF